MSRSQQNFQTTGCSIRKGCGAPAASGKLTLKARTVDVAFANTTPVPRAFGDNVLDVTSSAIRKERLDDGAAVLVNHAWEGQIWAVEPMRIEDGIARARLRFRRGARASEVFGDISDGIRRHVSVGYLVHKVEIENRDGQPDLVRVTD